MDNLEPGVEMFAPETILNTDSIDAATTSKKNKEDELISMETLRESPVQWPERFPGMDDFMNMSNTPIHTHTPSGDSNFTSADIAKINGK